MCVYVDIPDVSLAHKVAITQLYPATNWDAPPVGMSQKCTRLLSTRACGYLRRISPGNFGQIFHSSKSDMVNWD